MLFRDYLRDLSAAVSRLRSEGRKFAEAQKQLAYHPRFRYLEKSGLDRQTLERDHLESIKLPWNNPQEKDQ